MKVELVALCRSVLAAAQSRCRTLMRQDMPRIVAYHGPARLAGAVLAAVGFTVGLWWLVRPVAPPVESVLPRVVPGVEATSIAAAPQLPTSGDAPPEASSTDARRGRVRVHVAGAVRRPGVYTLTGDARVVDAVRAAGGATSVADLDRINLAQAVLDAEQVFVPRRGSVRTATTVASRHRPRRPSTTSTPSSSLSSTPSSSMAEVPVSPGPAIAGPAGQGTDARVNLNTATVEQLDALPGIGPATARAIVSYRTRKGPFAKVDDLLNIDGIGPKKLAAIKARVDL